MAGQWLVAEYCPHEIYRLLKELGFEITGDGTVDRDGIGQFARAFPLKGKQIGGRVRGGIKVTVGNHGTWTVR